MKKRAANRHLNALPRVCVCDTRKISFYTAMVYRSTREKTQGGLLSSSSGDYRDENYPAGDNNTSLGHRHCLLYPMYYLLFYCITVLFYNNYHNEIRTTTTIQTTKMTITTLRFYNNSNKLASLPQRTRKLKDSQANKAVVTTVNQNGSNTTKSQFSYSHQYCSTVSIITNTTQPLRVSKSERFMVTRLPRVYGIVVYLVNCWVEDWKVFQPISRRFFPSKTLKVFLLQSEVFISFQIFR